MNITRTFTSIFLLIYLFSCGYLDSHRTMLNRAELLVDEHADSAYTILSPIYLSDVRGKKNQARFALLYSKTLDKNWIDIKDDSLALFAVNYYADNGTDKEKATAYYYLGRVYKNAGDLDGCIKNMTLAGEIVPNDSYDLKRLIYGTLGDCCYSQRDYGAAILNHKIASEACIAINKHSSDALNILKMANSYGQLKRYDEALSSQHKALSIYVELKDTAKIVNTLGHIAISNLKNSLPTKFIKKELFNGYAKYNNNKIHSSNYWTLSEIYRLEGKIDSTIYYLNLYIENRTEGRSISMASKAYIYGNIEKLRGNYKKALAHTKSANSILDSFYMANINKLSQELHEKYKNKLYKQSLSESEQKREYQNYLFITTSIILFVLFLAVVYKYRLRITHKNQELSDQHEVLESLIKTKQILESQYNDIIEKYDVSNENIYNLQNKTTLNNLKVALAKFNDLIEKVPLYDNKPKKFLDEFINTMHNSNASESNAFLYDIVNRQYNGVLDRIKEEHNLTQYELNLCSMVCMGFSNISMRVLLGHTNPTTIYTYRSKLKVKLGCPISAEALHNLFNGYK